MESTRDGLLAGEFADLCGVSKDTLLYYDKIGLFSPQLVADNGYRVYSLDQVHTFDLLLILRLSRLPLKQIKRYLENRNSEEMLSLLKGRADSIQREIQELGKLRRRLESTAARMEWGMEPDQQGPRIQQRGEKLYVVVPVSPETLHDRKRRMTAVREFLHTCRLKGLQGDYLRNAVISKEQLLKGCFDKEYICVCLEGGLENEQTGETVIQRPAGNYAVLRHHGSYADIADSYRKLLSYIEAQGLTVAGNAYETELMGYIGEPNASNYVTEIAVEVGS